MLLKQSKDYFFFYQKIFRYFEAPKAIFRNPHTFLLLAPIFIDSAQPFRSLQTTDRLHLQISESSFATLLRDVSDEDNHALIPLITFCKNCHMQCILNHFTTQVLHITCPI